MTQDETIYPATWLIAIGIAVIPLSTGLRKPPPNLKSASSAAIAAFFLSNLFFYFIILYQRW